MNVEQLILLANAVATSAMAVLIYLTLREMYRQRRASYRPELLLPSAKIWGYLSAGARGQMISELPNRWSQEPLKPTRATHTIRPDHFTLAIFNVGLGAAKDIRATWRVVLGQDVLSLAPSRGDSPPALTASVDASMLRIETKGGSHDLYPISEDEPEVFSHLLPQMAGGDYLRLPLPDWLVALASAQFSPLVVWAERKPDEKGWSPIDSIHLDLEYSDIGGTRYRKGIDFELRLTDVFRDFAAYPGLAFKAELVNEEKNVREA